jgi:CRP-like cAMP-binding protein
VLATLAERCVLCCLYCRKDTDFSLVDPVAQLHKGQSFGELSLLENQPRNATIMAKVRALLFCRHSPLHTCSCAQTHATLMRIDKGDYLHLLALNHDAVLQDLVAFLQVRSGQAKQQLLRP